MGIENKRGNEGGIFHLTDEGDIIYLKPDGGKVYIDDKAIDKLIVQAQAEVTLDIEDVHPHELELNLPKQPRRQKSSRDYNLHRLDQALDAKGHEDHRRYQAQIAQIALFRGKGKPTGKELKRIKKLKRRHPDLPWERWLPEVKKRDIELSMGNLKSDVFFATMGQYSKALEEPLMSGLFENSGIKIRQLIGILIGTEEANSELTLFYPANDGSLLELGRRQELPPNMLTYENFLTYCEFDEYKDRLESSKPIEITQVKDEFGDILMHIGLIPHDEIKTQTIFKIIHKRNPAVHLLGKRSTLSVSIDEDVSKHQIIEAINNLRA